MRGDEVNALWYAGSILMGLALILLGVFNAAIGVMYFIKR